MIKWFNSWQVDLLMRHFIFCTDFSLLVNTAPNHCCLFSIPRYILGGGSTVTILNFNKDTLPWSLFSHSPLYCRHIPLFCPWKVLSGSFLPRYSLIHISGLVSCSKEVSDKASIFSFLSLWIWCPFVGSAKILRNFESWSFDSFQLRDYIFLNPFKKGKILQSGKGVNSILITILRFWPSSWRNISFSLMASFSALNREDHFQKKIVQNGPSVQILTTFL